MFLRSFPTPWRSSPQTELDRAIFPLKDMAAPPFGFSAGDFIAGVSLVRKSIRALNDSAGARASYRQLVSELSELDEALTGVSNLQLSPTQSAQKVALEQVVSQCQNSITAFLNQNSKFQRSLATASGQPSSTTRWKASIHKIQWALCKDGAIQTLRTEIQAHTRTLNLLLSTIQMYAFAVDVSSLMLSVQADQISSASAESQGTALGTCTNLVQRTHSQTGETLALVKQNQRILASQADQIASISSTVARFMTSRQADRVEANDPRLLVTDVMEANVMTELDAVNCNIEQNPQDKSGVSQQDKSLMYDFRRAEVLHLPMEATSPRLDDPDTLTVGALDLTLFWPRLYFLRVCQTRVDQVFGEWRAVVDRIELSLDQ